MPQFSAKSLAKLATCHPDLQKVFHEVIKQRDCTVLCGVRTKEEQDEAYHKGMSKKMWPASLHNHEPSLAIDVAPYPIDWSDAQGFYYFAGYVMRAADELGVRLRYGGDWNANNVAKDETFLDLVHFELA